MNPQISIIMPAYNAEATIERAIASVCSQGFTQWELLVINDGSQDQTLQIANANLDKRIKVHTIVHQGISAVRNYGISKASSNLISFLDADDYWSNSKLQSQYDALQNNPQCSIAFSWVVYVNGSKLTPGACPKHTKSMLQQMLTSNPIECGSNPLITKQALLDIGGFKSYLEPAEDWYAWICLAKKYKFVVVPEPAIFYTFSHSSASNNLSKLEAGCLKMVNHIYGEAPELQQFYYQQLAHIYKFLACKSLIAPINSQKAKLAIYFSWKFCLYNPNCFRDTKLIAILLAKSLYIYFYLKCRNRAKI